MESINFIVREATRDDVNYLKGKLREEDRQEVWDMHHLNEHQALELSFNISKKCWVGCIDNSPVMIFGVGEHSVSKTIGLPWMLATDRIKEVKVNFIRKSKEYIKYMEDGFKILENYVESTNELSKKWIKWCGFTIGKSVIIGYESKRFNYFYKECV